ncbi:hypothetical protein [Phenylobacterium koreense]|uniref:Uncharacterized protein n=1 Tax=Phenylobacterium koreense TaxID=266125 RepID=A0ABV2EGM0_9CAUL
MPAIPLGLSAYKRADLPPSRLRNMFYEKTPANLRDQVALIPRPRLMQFAKVGGGPVRGLFRQGGVIQDRILALSAGDLYRVEPSADGIGTPTLIGAVTGAGRMSAAGNPTTVVLACGEKVYSTDGETLTEIATPDDQHVVAVDTLNSYFLFQMANSGRFYWSAIGGTTIDPLDYATAESQPDNTTTLKVIGDVLWLVGRLSLEPWQPTGDLDLPFQRINGRIFGIGCKDIDTCQKLTVAGNETMCWVGADGVVYRLAPNPVRISDYGIEELIKKATGALYATTARWIGREFYVLHLPGQGSYACDLSTGFWDEWTSYERELFRGAVSTIGPSDQPLFGDDEFGTIWEFSDAIKKDAGELIVFRWSGVLANPGAAVRCNNVVLNCSVGQAVSPDDDPTVWMAISDDGGFEYGDWLPAQLGRQGERTLQVQWMQLGMIRRQNRLFLWETAEPVTVRNADYNEAYR